MREGGMCNRTKHMHVQAFTIPSLPSESTALILLSEFMASTQAQPASLQLLS